MSPYADNNNSQDPGGGFVVENNNSNSNSNNSQQQNVNNNNNNNNNINNNNNNKQSLNSSIGTPPPTTSINASGVNLSSINSVNLSSSSSSSSSPSPSPIPVPVIPSSIASISPVLSDIEQVLNAYPSDLPELVVAACWWAESLGKLNNNIPKENIKRFRKELIFSLRERVKGHWYPDYPERGQGFRAIICEETTDRILMDAAKNSDITGDFRSLVKQNTTMWIDPGNVTYRHGKHYEKTLYPFNSSSNSGSGSYGHYNSHHSSNSINFHQQQLNNSSNSTMIHPQQSQQHIISNTNTNNILLNSLQQSNNNFNYQTPIQINGINTTTTTSRLNLVNSNSNGLVGGSGVKVSSPSLSSTAPIFSPSSLMYQQQQQQQQHHIQQSNSPPASPSKDLTGNSSNNTSNVYSNNTNNNNLFYSNNSKIKQLAYS